MQERRRRAASSDGVSQIFGGVERRGQECPRIAEERWVSLKVGDGSALWALQRQHGVF